MVSGSSVVPLCSKVFIVSGTTLAGASNSWTVFKLVCVCICRCRRIQVVSVRLVWSGVVVCMCTTDHVNCSTIGVIRVLMRIPAWRALCMNAHWRAHVCASGWVLCNMSNMRLQQKHASRSACAVVACGVCAIKAFEDEMLTPAKQLQSMCAWLAQELNHLPASHALKHAWCLWVDVRSE